MENNGKLFVASPPHLREGSTTFKIMRTVSLCLVPAGIWGVYVFGLYSLAVLLTSITTSMLTEFIVVKLLKKEITLYDGSAFLTGLLIGYSMPPSIPLYVPVTGVVFAIAVVKHTFGGLGKNRMNPALAGRVFVLFSWTGPMTTWLIPKTGGAADAVTGASPLGFIKTGLLDFKGHVNGPMDFLVRKGYPFTRTDIDITAWLNQHIFSLWGGSVKNGYIDLFLGNIPGSIGEISAFLLLLGAVYLFAKKIITWEIPVFYLGTVSVLVWLFGGLRYGTGLFHGDVIFHLLSGGLILGAFYMATDMVTSPLTGKGMFFYGTGIGLVTCLIRFFGGFPEGVSLSIILMNVFVPLIDRLTVPVRFGFVKGNYPAVINYKIEGEREPDAGVCPANCMNNNKPRPEMK
ncbi:MAG: RnfABCDGE type electron transport complex subunit D [Spirochaetes bacterium]|nr:RnfABCDGE type electron transport complex subunit D [Spirochaetota bacterium]